MKDQYVKWSHVKFQLQKVEAEIQQLHTHIESEAMTLPQFYLELGNIYRELSIAWNAKYSPHMGTGELDEFEFNSLPCMFYNQAIPLTIPSISPVDSLLTEIDFEGTSELHPIEFAQIDGLLYQLRHDAKLSQVNRFTEVDTIQKEISLLHTLVQLLFDVDEKEAAKKVLRMTIFAEGDSSHQLYLKLFGAEHEAYYIQSVKAFSKQFGVQIEWDDWVEYLSNIYQTTPEVETPQITGTIDEWKEIITQMISKKCQLDISWKEGKPIKAGLSTRLYREEPGSDEVIETDVHMTFQYKREKWIQSDWNIIEYRSA